VAPAAVKTAAPMKAASAEAGASARRIAAFLSAMAETTESAGASIALAVRLGVSATRLAVTAISTGANVALATRLRITASGLAIATERLWRSFGTVIKAGRTTASAAGKLRRSFGTIVDTAHAFSSIEPVAVIKRPASRVIPLVVVDRVVVMPIETPVAPAPPVTPKEPDAEASPEKE
jgi:hypothetical protein